MKHLILFLIAMIGLAACKTTSHTEKSTTQVTKDSTAVHAKQASSTSDSSYHHTVTEDTTIGLRGYNAKLHLSAADLQPAYTKAGIAVPRTFTKDTGNIHANVNVNGDGSIDVDCKSDSLTYVIKRLIRDSVYQANKFDSLRMMFVLTAHSNNSNTEQVTIKKTTTTLMGKLLPLLIGAGVVLFLIYGIPFIIKIIRHHAS